MKKLFSKTSGIVTVCLLVLLACVGSYAYYSTVVAGKATSTGVAWSFKANNSATTFSNVALPEIAPGDSGSIPITLSAEGSGVNVDYKVSMTMAAGGDGNLVFYKDSTHQTPLTLGSNILTGTLEAGKTTTLNVYYVWQSSTNDATYAGKTTTFNITVVGTQVK